MQCLSHSHRIAFKQSTCVPRLRHRDIACMRCGLRSLKAIQDRLGGKSSICLYPRYLPVTCSPFEILRKVITANQQSCGYHMLLQCPVFYSIKFSGSKPGHLTLFCCSSSLLHPQNLRVYILTTAPMFASLSDTTCCDTSTWENPCPEIHRRPPV